MNPWIALATALAGYLIGAISFARFVTRLAAPDADLTQLYIKLDGSTEAERVEIFGANAASMVLGPKLGLLVAVLDMLKVVLPMAAVRLLYPDTPYHLIAAVAGLVGHNWPIYYRFRGGRGFAVIFASFLFLDWVGALASVAAGLFLGTVILGNPMIAYISWLWLMILWMAWQGGPWELGYAVIVNLIFVIATLPEISTMYRLYRQGKYRAYLAGLYNSSPRWRGMRKMAERFWLFKPRR